MSNELKPSTSQGAASPSPFARLLAHHYGDGLVYVPKTLSASILRDAVREGFVSEDGYVTRKGRYFLAQASAGNLRG